VCTFNEHDCFWKISLVKKGSLQDNMDWQATEQLQKALFRYIKVSGCLNINSPKVNGIFPETG
jgi:hypothetical protein